MRKLINYLCVLLLILAAQLQIQAQDFTVEIKSTDDYAGYIKPIKAGGSHPFQIKVKNNREDTCTVSIDKDGMGEVESWVSIEDNSLTIFPEQTVIFLLHITVPTNTIEGLYPMFLYFDAYAKGESHNNSFQYDAQWIIVDNSPPEAPTFSIGQKTSKTLSITSWSSWDQFSNLYTFETGSAAYGIKEYKIFIETLQGSVVETVIKQPSDVTNYKFKNLTPNVSYNACVTATDLVGYSTTTKKLVTMPPAQPTGLKFSNITYIGATLSWNTSDGATGYDVYKVTGSTNTTLNSSPVLGNSYIIGNLNPDSLYKFNIIALSNVGPSDRSNDASVTTLVLPKITGSSLQCSGAYTYTIQDLVSGYTVSWNSSSNLYKQSASGSSANFIKTSDGSGWIGANIIAPNARVLELTKKDVWIGKPAIPKTNPSGYPTISMQLGTYFNVAITEMKGASTSMSPLWTASGSLEIAHTTPNGCTYNAYTTGTGNFYVKTRNVCGYSPSGGGTVSVYSGGGGGGGNNPPFPMKLSISPNPANDYIEAYLENLIEEEQLDNEKLHIKIFNSYSIPVYNGTTQQKKLHINTSSFSEGIYYLQVQYKNKKFTKTILISH